MKVVAVVAVVANKVSFYGANMLLKNNKRGAQQMKIKWMSFIFIITFLVTISVGEVFSQDIAIGAEEDEEIGTEDIVEILTQIIPQPPGSSITVVPGQNKLIVRNTPSNLRKIENFIEDLSNPPQISIESKFVIIGEETYKDLGLEWTNISLGWSNSLRGTNFRSSGISDTVGGNTGWPYEGTGTPRPWSYDTITSSMTSGVNVVGITPPHVAAAGAGLRIAYQSRNYPEIAAVLHMLSTRSDTKFLSAPTVTTLNNEPAIVRFVKTINYVEDVDIETEVDEDTGDVTTSFDWEFTSRDIGIVMYVNPVVIRPNKSVRLFLQPVVSDAEGEDIFTVLVIDDQAIQIALPRFVNKDVTTNVDVYDGTTIVMGGLMSEETTELLSKVPFLGDIPVLGKAFFQRTVNAVEKQHLLIFITVNVLDSQGNPFFEKG